MSALVALLICWATLATLAAGGLWALCRDLQAEAFGDHAAKRLGILTRSELAVKVVAAEMRAVEAEEQLRIERLLLKACSEELDRIRTRAIPDEALRKEFVNGTFVHSGPKEAKS